MMISLPFFNNEDFEQSNIYLDPDRIESLSQGGDGSFSAGVWTRVKVFSGEVWRIKGWVHEVYQLIEKQKDDLRKEV